MAQDITVKALTARRESKSIEFKEGFDCDSRGEWCEVIKDLVAIANSGGGIVVFGLGNTGEPVDTDLSKIVALDPAEASNKIRSYTGSSNFEFSIIDLVKSEKNLVAFLISPASPPYIFERPGDYIDARGRPKSAFALGTLYFRHGAKSEPATNDDLRRVITRHIDLNRRELLTGLRKVVEAPTGSQVIVAPKGSHGSLPISNVKLGGGKHSTVVRLTRDVDGVAGTLLHEEVSDALFEEINNVIETNRLLFPGQARFLLGLQIYYRIYAERQHVKQSVQEISQLFHSGVGEYAPFLYWLSLLSDTAIADHLAEIILRPKGNEINTLLRIIPLLGKQCYAWLETKFTKKWGGHSQPPNFYWRLLALGPKVNKEDPRLIASHLSLQNQFVFEGAAAASVRDLLSDRFMCEAFVSKACIEVFGGDKGYKSIARDLDYLAYGKSIMQRGHSISRLLQELLGDRLPGDEESIETG